MEYQGLWARDGRLVGYAHLAPSTRPAHLTFTDCHVRIGGASGTSLNPDECPAVTSGVNANCNGGSLMMHITEQASGYFENMWLWVADHMVEYVQTSTRPFSTANPNAASS